MKCKSNAPFKAFHITFWNIVYVSMYDSKWQDEDEDGGCFYDGYDDENESEDEDDDIGTLV